MTVSMRQIVELEPTTHYRLVEGRWHRDHIARLVDGRRVVVWLDDEDAA